MMHLLNQIRASLTGGLAVGGGAGVPVGLCSMYGVEC